MHIYYQMNSFYNYYSKSYTVMEDKNKNGTVNAAVCCPRGEGRLRKMKELGYYNGKIGELDSMQVPMNDRACWFGDGVYDAGPCINYEIFAVDEHIDRLYRSASMLGIRVPVCKSTLKQILTRLVHMMDSGDLFVYVQVTRGTAMRSHVFPEVPANLWITLTPSRIHISPDPIRLISVEDTRYMHCNIKTLNLIPNVMAAQKAREAGCDEAVFYRVGEESEITGSCRNNDLNNKKRVVTECAHSNIHILKDGILQTHPADNQILPGIARAHLLQACREIGIPVCEKPFTVPEMMEADEVIVTSSSFPCMRAGEIDLQNVGMKDEENFRKLHSLLTAQILKSSKKRTYPKGKMCISGRSVL